MCIACELGFLIAMDALPDGPPPSFPRGDEARFACDAPVTATPAQAAQPEDEREP
jgi:hypothetical protein